MSSSVRQIIGSSCIHLDTVDSTHDFALKLLTKSNPIEGTVISADFQTRGRGQRDHFWQSEAGKNLLLSIILYPPGLTVGNQFYLSMFTANAVTSFLQTLLPPERLRIKWPNDLYFDHLKIGGILIRNILRGNSVESTVIGIGLNVNQTIFGPDLPNPGSLSRITGLTYPLNELRPSLYQSLNAGYGLIRNLQFKPVKTLYESLLYRKGESAEVKLRTGTYNGIILGVEPDGGLLLNIEGKIRKLMHS